MNHSCNLKINSHFSLAKLDSVYFFQTKGKAQEETVLFVLQNMTQHAFHISGEINNKHFAGHRFSITTTQLCHWGSSIATGDTERNKNGCVPVRLNLWILTYESKILHVIKCYSFNVF